MRGKHLLYGLVGGAAGVPAADEATAEQASADAPAGVDPAALVDQFGDETFDAISSAPVSEPPGMPAASGSAAEEMTSRGGGGGFLRAGSNSSPGGSTTTWARAPPRPERRARAVRPKASDANAEEAAAANAEEDASDDLRWARVFGGDGNAGPASRGGDADGGSAAASP